MIGQKFYELQPKPTKIGKCVDCGRKYKRYGRETLCEKCWKKHQRHSYIHRIKRRSK